MKVDDIGLKQIIIFMFDYFILFNFYLYRLAVHSVIFFYNVFMNSLII